MDDLEFIQRCLSKDKATWDEFLDRYSRLIYKYIHSVLKIKGRSFTEDHINDIFQDIFHSLVKDDFKKLRSFKGKNGCSLASWLRHVTVNHTLSSLRKGRFLVSLEEENEEGLDQKSLLADASPSVVEKLTNKESLLALEDCLQKLEADDKYFLELHWRQEVGLEELQGMLGISRGAMDMQKHRILEKLRDCFKVKGFLIF